MASSSDKRIIPAHGKEEQVMSIDARLSTRSRWAGSLIHIAPLCHNSSSKTESKIFMHVHIMGIDLL